MAKHSVGIRELSHTVSAVVAEVERTGEPVVVTRYGRPAVAILPVSGERLQALTLQLIPHLVQRGFGRADQDLAAGHTYSLDDAIAALDREESTTPAEQAAGASTSSA